MSAILGSSVLEVAIGVIFVYLLLSMICTVVNEWISTLFSMRSNNLRRALQALLDNQTLPGGSFIDAFYKHPLISGMADGGDHLAYLDARTFAETVMDVTAPGGAGAQSFQQFQDGVASLPDGDVKKALSALLTHSHQDLDQARASIEGWYNRSMDRASGWYKRNLHALTAVVAVAIVLAANADTLHMVRVLWVNSALRSVAVQAATVRAGEQPADLSTQEAQMLGDIIGWSEAALHVSPWDWVARVLGWVLSIFAVALGAPFWFDALKSIVNLRSSGPSPQEAEAARQAAQG